MPRRGGGTTPEEALRFVDRISTEKEGLYELADYDEWQRYVRQYLTGDPEGELTPGTEEFTAYVRELVIGQGPEAGVNLEEFTTAAGTEITRFRDLETGRFIGAGDVWDKLWGFLVGL